MSGAAGGATAAAAIANAIKASGVIVKVDPEEFRKLAERAGDPLVVIADALFGGKKYLMSYKGLAFYTKTSESLSLPADSEVVTASRIWVPS